MEPWGFVIDGLVALIAAAGLAVSISEKRARRALERELHKPRISFKTNIADDRLKLVIKNDGSFVGQVTRFTYFVGNESFRPNRPEHIVAMIKAIGLSSPKGLDLHVHAFETPLYLGPSSEITLIDGQFEQGRDQILAAVRKIRIKLSTESPLGEKDERTINPTSRDD